MCVCVVVVCTTSSFGAIKQNNLFAINNSVSLAERKRAIIIIIPFILNNTLVLLLIDISSERSVNNLQNYFRVDRRLFIFFLNFFFYFNFINLISIYYELIKKHCTLNASILRLVFFLSRFGPHNRAQMDVQWWNWLSCLLHYSCMYRVEGARSFFSRIYVVHKSHHDEKCVAISFSIFYSKRRNERVLRYRAVYLHTFRRISKRTYKVISVIRCVLLIINCKFLLLTFQKLKTIT